MAEIKTKFKNPKLDWCKNELKSLLEKLLEDQYKTTAEFIFTHIAHTGVDTDLDSNLKKEPTMEDFLQAE